MPASHRPGASRSWSTRSTRDRPGLHRLQRHPGPRSRVRQVPQLVTGRVGQPGPGPGAVHHLVRAVRRQRPSTARTLEDQEHRVGVGVGRSLLVKVGSQVLARTGEIGARRCATALAVSDEHPPLGRVDVAQAKAQHSRNGAARPAPSPRPSPGPGESATPQSTRRPRPGPGSAARSGAGPAPAAHPGRAGPRSRRVGNPRGTGLPGTSPRTAKNAYNPPTVDSRRRIVREQTPTTPLGDNPASRVRAGTPPGALGGDEPQHVRRPYLVDRLGHHLEEDLQVEPGSQHRVRPAPHRQELQVVIQQRITQPVRRHDLSRRNRAWQDTRHRGASSRRTDTPT